MKLTPLDIRHKEFARSMRGYKDIEVDEFLDDIADEFERIFNENIDYRERLEGLEEKNEQYKNIEETLKKTLVSAQQQAEELKHNAKKESDLILRDAELKARSILNDSYAERQKIQRSVQALKQKQEDLKYQMKSMLETYLNILDQDDFELEPMTEADAEVAVAAAAEPAGATEASPGVDDAVSRELLAGGQAPLAEPTATAAEEATQASAGQATAKEAARPHTDGEHDDPFADVDIDIDDSNFKW